MNSDGTLSPWTSPGGVPLHIAAAAPVIPWSDLTYSLMPNGRTLDYAVTGPTTDLQPDRRREAVVRVRPVRRGQRQRLLRAAGHQLAGRPDDLVRALNAGEPYDGNPEDEAIATQIAQYHSPYYLLDGAYGTAHEAAGAAADRQRLHRRPVPGRRGPPLLQPRALAVPADPISLFDGDFGHMRAQQQARRRGAAVERDPALLRLLPEGRRLPAASRAPPRRSRPARRARRPAARTRAATWAALHPGEVDYSSAPAQTILLGRRQSDDLARRSTRSPARAPARPSARPTRAPAWPPTACPRPPAAATRCSARRR